MDRLENVSVLKVANVYFDGACVSHTVIMPDGNRKSVGVILPGTLTFNTAAPEVMELIKGRCRVQPAGSREWQDYVAGDEFRVPGESSFRIEVSETLHYVCHFG